jgi:hypothetical protein
MRISHRVLFGFFLVFFDASLASAGEHPLFRGVVQNCRGLSTYQCIQAKRTRITKVTNTIRACERGIIRYCDLLLQIKDLSNDARAHVKQARARATQRGGGSPVTQFLRRNTREAPRGGYTVPQVTLRSGVPPGVSSGYPAGVSTGYPRGLSTGVPRNVTSGVPNNVRSGVPNNVRSGVPKNITTGVPRNVTTDARARSGIPSNVTAKVPNNVRAEVPSNVKITRPATASVPSNVRSSVPSTVTTGVPDNVHAAVSPNVTTSSIAAPGKGGWSSIPTKEDRDATTSKKADEILATVGAPRSGPVDQVAARHRKGIEYVKDSPEVKEALEAIQIKVAAQHAAGKLGYNVADIALTIDGAVESIDEFKAGNFYEGSLKALNQTSSAIGDRLRLPPYGSDLLNLSAAATTAYLYGYTKGYDMSRPSSSSK